MSLPGGCTMRVSLLAIGAEEQMRMPRSRGKATPDHRPHGPALVRDRRHPHAPGLRLRADSEGLKGLQPNTICEVCGRPFYASPGHRAVGWGRFCSFACRGAAWKQSLSPNATCKGCGRMFHVKPTALRNNKGRAYCSPECHGAALNRTRRECPICGRVFWDYPSQPAKYCSPKCMGIASRRQVKVNCLQCGTEFEVRQSRISNPTVKNASTFCSRACKAKFMSASSRSSGGVLWGTRSRHGGFREDLGLYVRSAWEANYARYLNWLQGQGLIARWEYEPDTFEFKTIRRGSRFYTPDFRVEWPDGPIEYHEVKGYLDERSDTKLKRMAKYFPDVKLVLIGKDRYRDIGDKVGQFIAGWEWTGI